MKLTEEPEQRGLWWLDARARRQMMDNLRLDPDYLTFTVYEARPLRMTHAEVRARMWQPANVPVQANHQQNLFGLTEGLVLWALAVPQLCRGPIHCVAGHNTHLYVWKTRLRVLLSGVLRTHWSCGQLDSRMGVYRSAPCRSRATRRCGRPTWTCSRPSC